MTTSNYAVFRHLAIERAKSPASVEEIAALESALGAQLPASFVEFLQVANGGHIEYLVDVEVDGVLEVLSFSDVFSTGPEDSGYGTFLYEVHKVRENSGAPRGVLPIARDGGGSMLYLDMSDDGEGRVVAFVAALPGWAGSESAEPKYITVAESFDAYVEKLRLDREELLENLQRASKLAHVAATEEFLDIGLPAWRDDAALSAAVESARQRLG